MAVDYQKEGRIAIFTINRPEVMNAINTEVTHELYEAMVDFRDDDELRVGIITGAGEKSFSAGADIKGSSVSDEQGVKTEPRPTIGRGLEIWKPLIAAINGYCLGRALEMAMACDIRIAADHARLGFPEITRGSSPALGGTQMLTRMIPRGKAAEILLMGKPIDAQEAYRIGLVNKIVPLDQLLPTAKEWAGIICQAAPLAIRATKESMAKGYDMILEDGLR